MNQDAKDQKQDEKSSAAAEPASGKTYTEAEVEAIRRDLQGHKDRGIAEAMRWANAGLLEISQLKASVASLTAERDEALASKEGGPDIVAITKRLKDKEKELAQKESELNLDKLVHEGEKAKVNEHKRQEKIREVATEFKVKPEQIAELNPQTEEDMRKYAKILSASVTAPPPADVKQGSAKETNDDILARMYPKTPPPKK